MVYHASLRRSSTCLIDSNLRMRSNTGFNQSVWVRPPFTLGVRVDVRTGETRSILPKTPTADQRMRLGAISERLVGLEFNAPYTNYNDPSGSRRAEIAQLRAVRGRINDELGR